MLRLIFTILILRALFRVPGTGAAGAIAVRPWAAGITAPGAGAALMGGIEDSPRK